MENEYKMNIKWKININGFKESFREGNNGRNN